MEAQTGLFAKMVKVMARMERIPKRGRNTHFNYDFVTDADVLDEVRKALVEEGVALFVSFDEAIRRDEGGVTVGKFTLTFADVDSGQTHSVNWVGEGQDKQDKGAAKAATSAVKYALLKTFLISTGDEADDPDASVGARQNTAPRRAARPQRPAPAQTAPPPEPRDLWDAEAEGGQEVPVFRATTLKVLKTRSNKPYLMFTDGGDTAASWWGGRDGLIQAAPWIAQKYTKEQLGEIGTELPLDVVVYYEVKGDYRNATAFEQANGAA